MRKIAISILIVGSVLCYSQTTKKKSYKKTQKKTYVQKKASPNPVAAAEAGAPEPEDVKAEVVNEPTAAKGATVAVSPAEKSDYEKTAEKLLKQKGWINNRNSYLVRGVEGFVKGVYSGNGKIFIMLEVSNRSNINYDIQNISFITSPIKKKGTHFDTEEKIFLPIWSNQPDFIGKKAKQKLVFVFDKFTIGENKTLNAVINENEGERNLKLEIKPAYILSAEYIN